MWKVVTTNGGTLHKREPGSDGVPLSKASAEKLAEQANKDAEKLGIETRYEVKDVKGK